MILTVFFVENGIPKTGLSPTIRIRNVDTNALIVTDASMSEVGDGFYKYDFASYDASINYVIRMDGGDTLANAERYCVAANESYREDVASQVWATTIDGTSVTTSQALNIIRKVEVGKWAIVGNQMIFYEEDNVTPLLTFNLDDASAPAMRTPV